MTTPNRVVHLARRPTGSIDADTFTITDEVLPDLTPGQFLVRTVYLSIEPGHRVWLHGPDPYIGGRIAEQQPGIVVGDVIRGSGVGQVVESRNDGFPIGQFVTGMLGWQDYSLFGSEHVLTDDSGGVLMGDLVTAAPEGIPVRSILSVFGAGLTAYFAMLDLGQPQPGDTVVVSSAGGAVGSIAGQIAKIRGARAIGIAGTQEKCAWVVDDLGFDACIDYKSQDVRERLRELCPQGIDVYFDNVGGRILDEALLRLALRARIVACGTISMYDSMEDPEPVHWYMNIVTQRARMEGFLIVDYVDRFPEGIEQLMAWERAGALQFREHVVHGLERAPDALGMLFRGENFGKLLVQVGPDPGSA